MNTPKIPKPRLHRLTTIPLSLDKLLEGQPAYFSQFYDVTLLSAEPVALESVAHREGVDFYPIRLTRQLTPLHDLKTLWQLYRYFRRTKPYIVHTHTPKAGITGMLAARLAGVPKRLHTVGGLPLMETHGLKRSILKWVERLTAAAATRVYPNSFALHDYMIAERLAPPTKLKVLGNGSSNGIDLTFFDPNLFPPETCAALRQSLQLTSEHLVFTFAGRLVPDKGITELVAAFVKLHPLLPHCRLLLLGESEPQLTPLPSHTQHLIDTHPGIHLTGWLEDVRPALSISDLFVFPSYREGMPNVVLQAGAMGLPQIVTDINGCNEIVTHGDNGLIVPPKDTEALYRAMLLLAEDTALRHKLAQHARSAIATRFQRSIIWEALLKEYQQ